MHKIPVQATISGAYSFAFGNILSVLGIVWFPYLLLAAIVAGAIYVLAPDLLGHVMRGEFDLPTLFSLARVWGVVFLAMIVVRAMVTVGLQRKALGRAPGPSFFYFSLSAPVWRMIGAYILAFLVVLLIYALTALAAFAISFAAIKFVPNFGKAIAAVAVIVAVLWVIYAVVRLMFFLPAVVVAEEHIGLARSWELGGGNFWRIIAVFFVVFVPVAMGVGIVSQALTGPFMPPPDFAAHFGPHPNFTPNEIGPMYMKLIGAYFQQIRPVLAIFIALQIIQTVIFLGLGNGAIANAYLGVTAPAMPDAEGTA
jgi:hypothetical protein